jgi:hypothetical protein
MGSFAKSSPKRIGAGRSSGAEKQVRTREGASSRLGLLRRAPIVFIRVLPGSRTRSADMVPSV